MAGVGVLLAFARLWPLLLLQVAWRRAVGTAWWWLSAWLAFALALSAPEPAVAPPGLGAWAHELATGLALGAVVSLPGLALMGAADTSARVIWPGGEGSELLPAAVLWAAGSVALAAGLHHSALLALRDLGDALPPGAALGALADGARLARLLGVAATLGLALATPALLTAALATTAARLLQEAGGATEVSGGASGAAQAWARAGAALVALGASLAARGQDWAQALLPGGVG